VDSRSLRGVKDESTVFRDLDKIQLEFVAIPAAMAGNQVEIANEVISTKFM
jgi:hypothetical protein